MLKHKFAISFWAKNLGHLGWYNTYACLHTIKHSVGRELVVILQFFIQIEKLVHISLIKPLALASYVPVGRRKKSSGCLSKQDFSQSLFFSVKVWAILFFSVSWLTKLIRSSRTKPNNSGKTKLYYETLIILLWKGPRILYMPWEPTKSKTALIISVIA